MIAVLVLVVAGFVTWLLRASFILLGDRVALPSFAERIVANARPAFLAALVASAFVAQGGGEVFAIPLPWIGAAVAGIVVSKRTGSLSATGAAGIATVTLLTAAEL